MFAAGKELVSRRAGLIAAALTATSPLMIWYSQEARAYALLVLFGAASVYYFARLLNNPTRGNYVAFGVVSGLALLSHYLAGLLFVAEAVALYWDPARRHATRWVVAGYALPRRGARAPGAHRGPGGPHAVPRDLARPTGEGGAE